MINRILINGPIYQRSPNPHAASIVPDQPQNPLEAPMSEPSPAPELRDKSTTQPTVPPPASQPDQQQDSSRSSLQIEYGYPILSGMILAVTVVIGIPGLQP